MSLVSTVLRSDNWIFPSVLAMVSLRGIIGSNQQRNHRHGLGFAFAVLLDLLSRREDPHVLQNRPRDVLFTPATGAGGLFLSPTRPPWFRESRIQQRRPHRSRPPKARAFLPESSQATRTGLRGGQFAFQDRLIFGDGSDQRAVRAILQCV